MAFVQHKQQTVFRLNSTDVLVALLLSYANLPFYINKQTSLAPRIIRTYLPLTAFTTDRKLNFSTLSQATTSHHSNVVLFVILSSEGRAGEDWKLSSKEILFIPPLQSESYYLY